MTHQHKGSQSLKAVILDWAGTVVDHGCVGPAEVFVRVFAARGVDITVREARCAMGLKKIDHVRAICALPGVIERWRARFGRAPGEDDVHDLYRDTEPMMVAAVESHAEAITGALEAVDVMRGMGLKIGSTTGYTGPIMARLLPLASAQGYVPDSVFCSTDVPAGRPAPYMIWRCCAEMGVYPLTHVVKIGDTVADVQEGVNAGCWTIGLTRTGNELGLTEAELAALEPGDLAARLAVIASELRAAGAHYVALSLGDCPALLDDINRRLAAGERP